MNTSHRRIRSEAYRTAVARRRARQLRLLQDVGHQIAAALEVDVVLERLVHSIFASFGYWLVAAALVEGDRLVFRSAAAVPGVDLPPLPDALPLDRPGLTASVARQGQPVLIGDALADPIYSSWVGDRAIRSEMVVPMIGRGGVIGVIDVQSVWTDAFDRYDLDLLTTLAEYAAIAIENARMYQAAQERSREQERLYQKERLLVADMEHSYNELLHTLTELERRDQQLQRAERLSALGELASGVAHDFNNLLAGILGNAQILLIDEPDIERRRMLRVIEQAAQDGAATVRRIQEFARHDENQVQELVNLTEVIDGALAITRPRWHNLAQREGRPIQVQREIETIPLVRGSAAELRELLINLIVNAVDAMPEGGSLTVRLAEQAAGAGRGDQRMAALEVCDTGVGIPPDQHERIFETFFTTKADGKGSGLGLAICRQIAARHGGEIDLRSAAGQGTTFRVLIPTADQPAPAAEVANQPTSTRPLRALVVDDDTTVREVLERILRRAGHTVVGAASGEEALARFAPGAHDLILTDISLPGIDGAALLREVRARDPQIATAIVTGWGYLDDCQDCPRGASVIAKPFDITQVHRLLGDLARRDAV